MKITFSSNCNAVKCLKSVVDFLESNAGETLDVRYPGVMLEFALFSWDPFSIPRKMVSKECSLNDYQFELSGPIPNYMTIENIQMAITGCKESMLCHINSITRRKEKIHNEIDFINNKRAVAVEKGFNSVKHWDERLKETKQKENRIISEIEDCGFYQQCIEANQLSFKISFENGGYNEKYDFIKVLPLLDITKTVYPVFYSDNCGFSSVKPFLWYRYAVERKEEKNKA